MLAERKRLEAQLKNLDLQLRKLPKGNLFCSHTGKYVKWFQTDGKNQTYIPKKNRFLAEQLATKKYLLLLQKDLLHEKTAIDFYLRHHKETGQAEQLLNNIPEYQKLLSPSFTPTSKELVDWMNSPYEHNPTYAEQLIHKAHSGIYVRSKSESIIDMLLHTNKIPFRYECALQLGSLTIYPDFTIRHPQTGKIFYWEHFGLMDEPDYSKNACSKLQLYTSHGIIPSINLITTYETKDAPLSSEVVEKIIEHYFL